MRPAGKNKNEVLVYPGAFESKMKLDGEGVDDQEEGS